MVAVSGSRRRLPFRSSLAALLLASCPATLGCGGSVGSGTSDGGADSPSVVDARILDSAPKDATVETGPSDSTVPDTSAVADANDSGSADATGDGSVGVDARPDSPVDAGTSDALEACVPLTCATAGCGASPDGCGGTISCPCPTGNSCDPLTHQCGTGCAGGLVCEGSCCDGTQCQQGNSNSACGPPTGACAACSTYETCRGQACTGQCASGADCTNGGCCGNGTCQAGTTAAACGLSGTDCVACPPPGNGTVSCQLGACVVTCQAGYSQCGAECVDLQYDPNNCGTCGHGCLGGACSGGLCQPILLAPAQVFDLAVEGSNIYLTADFTVSTVPITGGSPVVLASGQNYARGIAVDGTNIYWANHAMRPSVGTIMSMPLSGGSPVVLASDPNAPNDVAVDAANVYWTDDGGAVQSVPLTGGNPTTLATSPSQAYAIAVDSTSVYWTVNSPTSQGNLMQVPLGGGPPVTLASCGGFDLALDSVNIYLGSYSCGVLEIPLGGGSARGLGGGTIYGIVVDSSNVYWSNAATTFGSPSTINKSSLSTGVTTQLATEFIAGPLAEDATSLYFISDGVYRLAK